MNLLYTYGMYYKKTDGQLQKKEGRKIPPPPFRISNDGTNKGWCIGVPFS